MNKKTKAFNTWLEETGGGNEQQAFAAGWEAAQKEKPEDSKRLDAMEKMQLRLSIVNSFSMEGHSLVFYCWTDHNKIFPEAPSLREAIDAAVRKGEQR